MEESYEKKNSWRTDQRYSMLVQWWWMRGQFSVWTWKSKACRFQSTYVETAAKKSILSIIREYKGVRFRRMQDENQTRYNVEMRWYRKSRQFGKLESHITKSHWADDMEMLLQERIMRTSWILLRWYSFAIWSYWRREVSLYFTHGISKEFCWSGFEDEEPLYF